MMHIYHSLVHLLYPLSSSSSSTLHDILLHPLHLIIDTLLHKTHVLHLLMGYLVAINHLSGCPPLGTIGTAYHILHIRRAQRHRYASVLYLQSHVYSLLVNKQSPHISSPSSLSSSSRPFLLLLLLLLSTTATPLSHMLELSLLINTKRERESHSPFDT
jgi:hypothetical protein